MEFNYNIEGGNFSRAGTASSEVKKILKQLNVNPAVLKRIVVALYEAEVTWLLTPTKEPCKCQSILP